MHDFLGRKILSTVEPPKIAFRATRRSISFSLLSGAECDSTMSSTTSLQFLTFFGQLILQLHQLLKIVISEPGECRQPRYWYLVLRAAKLNRRLDTSGITAFQQFSSHDRFLRFMAQKYEPLKLIEPTVVSRQKMISFVFRT